MMIEIAFIACLKLQPDLCEERTLSYADLPLMTCMLVGQQELAKWSQVNPAFQVKRWSCRTPRPADRA